MRASAFTTVTIAGLLAAGAGVAQPAPRGAQFQANSETTSAQKGCATAVNAFGQFLVVWETEINGSSLPRVKGQLYAADGSAQGAEFEIDATAVGIQRSPAVAARGTGSFIVVWSGSATGGGDTDGIHGRGVSSSGGPSGIPFHVNTFTTAAQGHPQVATWSDDEFVVVWQSDDSDTDFSSGSVQGRRFFFDGLTEGGDQFEINSITTDRQGSPDVAVDADGGFWVVFESSFPSGADPDGSIQARHYGGDGVPDGPEFVLNQSMTGDQVLPAVAVDAAGLFLAVWESPSSAGTDTSSKSIQGYFLDGLGDPLGDEFQVNSYTTSSQRRPAVAPHGDSDFVVAWESGGSLGGDTGLSIQARPLSVPNEFQVNSYTTGVQTYPAIAADPTGNFVVAWESAGSPGGDSSSTSVQGRRYDALFADGFASGTLLRWSSALP